MLTKEENELLCRVGPGTPMGELFRRYWIIAGISREIPEPDSTPVRVKLLGEDLVMFRDTTGKVGLLAEKCSHRRASLFYGRNEECGLRCIYHGWKYDVEGNILDTPAEPAESMIKHHVKHAAYPTFEKNGIVMTYMGPKEKQPLVPNHEWLTLPEDQVEVEGKFWNENNWLQSIEGDCDSSHLNYLHRNADAEGSFELASGMATGLHFEIDSNDWLVRAAAIRHLSPEYNYIRTNFFLMPSIGGPPQATRDGFSDGFQAVHQVPADDYHTWRIDIWTKRTGPLNRRMAGNGLQGWPGVPDGARPVGPDWKKTANKDNDYLIDREMQKNKVYAGIPFGPHTQDAVVTESMGPIADRENEHLGLCDAQPARMREIMLKAVREVQAGKDAPGVAFREEDNVWPIRMPHVTLPPGIDWRDEDAVREHMLYSGAPPTSGRTF